MHLAQKREENRTLKHFDNGAEEVQYWEKIPNRHCGIHHTKAFSLRMHPACTDMVIRKDSRKQIKSYQIYTRTPGPGVSIDGPLEVKGCPLTTPCGS